MSNSLRYYRAEKEKFFYILIWCLILAGFSILINYYVLAVIFSNQLQYLVFLQQTIPLRFGVTLLTISWMTMVSLLWHSLQDRREHENGRQMLKS